MQGVNQKLLKRKVIITADGSTTLHIPAWNEQYHSKHGAIQEAYHVFIKNGLSTINKKEISVLEIGLGTGLNCFITLLEADVSHTKINYTGVEAYPIKEDELLRLNFVNELSCRNLCHKFEEMHLSPWEKWQEVTPDFRLLKKQMFIHNISDEDCYDLVYFDAFGARVQPELWTEDIFEKMYKSLRSGGVLVTYSAKGSVRRALQAVGFEVSRLPGPPGKREMLKAVKLQ